MTVQKVCTHFCVMRKGQKLHEGAVSDILGETNIVEVAANDMDALASSLNLYGGIDKVVTENDSLYVHLKDGHTSEELNRFCFDNGISLKKLFQQTKSLEQEFLKILKENA